MTGVLSQMYQRLDPDYFQASEPVMSCPKFMSFLMLTSDLTTVDCIFLTGKPCKGDDLTCC